MDRVSADPALEHSLSPGNAPFAFAVPDHTDGKGFGWMYEGQSVWQLTVLVGDVVVWDSSSARQDLDGRGQHPRTVVLVPVVVHPFVVVVPHMVLLVVVVIVLGLVVLVLLVCNVDEHAGVTLVRRRRRIYRHAPELRPVVVVIIISVPLRHWIPSLLWRWGGRHRPLRRVLPA